MKIDPKPHCPIDGFKPCRQLECGWFIKLRGHNPNTGEEIDDWGCAIALLPILMIENSQLQRQTGAAVESFRNEMVKANQVSQQVLLAAASANNPDLKFIEVK